MGDSLSSVLNGFTSENAIQVFVGLAVLVTFVMVLVTYSRVQKIKQEVVPSVQPQNVLLDATVPVAAGSVESTWVQPANTRILSVVAVPLSVLTATAATSSIGTTAGGGELSAAAGALLAAGATVPGVYITPTLLAAAPLYTSVSRTTYFKITSAAAQPAGLVVRWIIKYESL